MPVFAATDKHVVHNKHKCGHSVW